MTQPNQILGLVAWLAVSFAASAAGAVASINASDFYNQLVQPEWAPPAWLFGPVWTALFAMMAIAAWLVWRSGGFIRNRSALMLYLIQLGVNALWSWLFFAWHLGGLAFADIILLLGLIVATTIAFRRVSLVAGYLMIPYLLWVCFAAALNFSIWQTNPEILG